MIGGGFWSFWIAEILSMGLFLEFVATHKVNNVESVY